MEDTQRTADTLEEVTDEVLVLCPLAPQVGPPCVIAERTVLGRAKDAGYVVDVERVSRYHCEILREGPIVTVRDLNSVNGTFVDGRRVEHAVLRPGSLLRAGHWLGLVEQRPRSELGNGFSQVSPGVLGGAALARAFRPIPRCAPTDLPIALTGETGTGKERFAGAIHRASGRSGSFHAVNCACIPPPLAEVELFGCIRGAFTGADGPRIGHLRAASGGTLFLDELPELPLSVQAKLLRALETQQVTPLGETRSYVVDVRVVTAAQQPLPELVARGVLREDLAARLAGLTVSIPPLRDRRADIPALFLHFVRTLAGAAPPAVSVRLLERLCMYDWPANVRELETFTRRLVALHGDQPVLRRRHAASHLPELSPPLPDERTGLPSRNDHDRRRLIDALERNGGNMKRSAASIGISRQRAYRLMSTDRPGVGPSLDGDGGE